MSNAFELIFPADFDKRAEWEAEQRGLLDYVKLRLDNGLAYGICFFTPSRIAVELDLIGRAGEPCFAEPGLIVVPAVTRSVMEAAVAVLATTGYFDRLPPEAAQSAVPATGLMISVKQGNGSREEDEARRRGYRGDVRVELSDGRRFALVIYNPTRLAQDVERLAQAERSYFAEPNMIIVPEVTTERITAAVRALASGHHFDRIFPEDPQQGIDDLVTTTQALLDRVVALLSRGATNYTVFLRLYRSPIAGPNVDPGECVRKALGEDVRMGGAEEIEVADLLAEVDEHLRFEGDPWAGPAALALKSAEFADLLLELRKGISELAGHADRVERFWLKAGHPAYPVFWDFAYLLVKDEMATILVGSSSD